MRKMGPDTCPAGMLKAISSPTVSRFSITSDAPSHMMPSVTSLLTSITALPATVDTFVADSPAAT